jgi:hypothetical protein
MKRFVTIIFSIIVLVACNLKEGIKETGDAVGVGVENIIEGVKQAPEAIGKASNKIEADIRK